MEEFTTAAVYAQATRLAASLVRLRGAQQLRDVEPGTQGQAIVYQATDHLLEDWWRLLAFLPDGGDDLVAQVVDRSLTSYPAGSASPEPEGPF